MGARGAAGSIARALPAPVRVGSPLLLWALGALIFFRRPISSGFTMITGDDGDTRLIVYLHEHWLLVVRGLDSWNDPAFFFPTTGALGYTDTFVLDEVFYAPLRLAGLDPYLAFELTLVLLSLVGFFGFYFLVGRILPGHRWTCATLALTFTFSNLMYVQAGHSQLYSVYWLPTLVALVMRARNEHRPDRWWAFLAGLLLGFLLLSTFYVAWFGVMSAMLWLITRWLLTPEGRIAGQSRVRSYVIERRRRVAAFAVGAAVGGIPFLVVYLPALGSGSRSLGDALVYAAEPRDILNTGARNWLWGPLTRLAFGHSSRLGNGELGFGLTPVLLATLVAATIFLVRRHAGAPALATVVTTWTAIILPMKFFGVSLWGLVYLVVPGARAIRAIDRLGVIAGLLAPLVVAFVIAELLRRNESGGRTGLRRRLLLGSSVLVLAMAIEQFNVGRNATIDRPAELAALAAVPVPPPTCRVFYLDISTTHPPPAYASSIDAMLISQDLTSRRIPMATINGFSGQFPPGFGSVASPGSSTYAAGVRTWITAHHLGDDVCSYDPVARRWAGPSA